MEKREISEQQINSCLDSNAILNNNQQEEDDGAEMTFEQFLVYSARLGEVADVQEMLEVTGPPVDVNYRDNTMSHNTALHMAAANGHLKIVEMLIKVEALNPNIQNDSGNTALHYACLNGHLEVVKLFVDYKKCDKNIKNETGRIALEDALQTQHTEIAEILAPVSTLEDDKIYASPNPNVGDSNLEGIFEEEEGENADKRSVQSEEQIRSEEPKKKMDPEQLKQI